MKDYSFGNFLYELRVKRGLSQYQLGALVGVSDKAVSKWENGSAKPKTGILYKLGEVLGVSVDELLNCRYDNEETQNAEVPVKVSEILNKAYHKLCEYCGNNIPFALAERFESERAVMQSSEMPVFLELVSRLSQKARMKQASVRMSGAMGSTFIGFLLGATEINPLPAHYRCPVCGKIKLADNANDGWDLPVKMCECNCEMERDGHNIPFEVLLKNALENTGYELQVSEAFMDEAEALIREFFDNCNIVELERKEASESVVFVWLSDEKVFDKKRIVLSWEDNYSKYDKYSSIKLFKYETLELCGKLEKQTGVKLESVNYLENEVLAGFKRLDTDGIPEFDTEFVKNMISETGLEGFGDLIKISGLCHGSGTWKDNGQELLHNGASLKELVAYRDDVFNYVQDKIRKSGFCGTGFAYKIMECSKFGLQRKLEKDASAKQVLTDIGVEERFVDSLYRITYLFPKAHGVLYVKYALIFMWYKIHYPEIFEKVISE